MEAHIVGPAGLAASVELNPAPLEEGVYTADWTAEKPGSYVAEIVVQQPEGSKPNAEDDAGSDVITFRREDGVAENFRTAQNRELLEKLAEQTGGRYYTAKDMGRLAERDLVFGSRHHHARNQRSVGYADRVPAGADAAVYGVAAAAKVGVV